MKARMFEVKINLGNEAMQTPTDVYYALLRVAKQLRLNTADEFDGDHDIIMDENGISVGKWEVT